MTMTVEEGEEIVKVSKKLGNFVQSIIVTQPTLW